MPRKAKVKTQKREIAEGTEEFDLLHSRYYAEELKKLGIDSDAVKPAIVVLGSLNMDFVVRTEHLPAAR